MFRKKPSITITAPDGTATEYFAKTYKKDLDLTSKPEDKEFLKNSPVELKNVFRAQADAMNKTLNVGMYIACTTALIAGAANGGWLLPTIATVYGLCFALTPKEPVYAVENQNDVLIKALRRHEAKDENAPALKNTFRLAGMRHGAFLSASAAVRAPLILALVAVSPFVNFGPSRR